MFVCVHRLSSVMFVCVHRLSSVMFVCVHRLSSVMFVCVHRLSSVMFVCVHRLSSVMFVCVHRLSSVMVFEQNFADHFLLTAIARLCIGQACRSGIVTPLIETMTEESKYCVGQTIAI